MITLSKIPYASDWIHKKSRRIDELEADALRVYQSSVYRMLAAGREFSGWITVEPTPGTYNYNPLSKLAKIVYYQNEPMPRYGFYAKLRIMPNGDLRSC